MTYQVTFVDGSKGEFTQEQVNELREDTNVV